MVELAIYAFVAAFIFFRLYSSLGRASGMSFGSSRPQLDALSSAHTSGNGGTENDDVPLESVVDRESLEQVAPIVEAIQRKDKLFSLGHFVDGSAAAFELIIKAFGEGELAVLRSLLKSEVYDSFAQEVEKRKSAGLVREDTIVSVSHKIVGATLDEDIASISVRFSTKQINVVRSAEDGTVLEGSISKINTVVDTWRFEKDTTAATRKWLLASTVASPTI